jgi:hypothetical protein
MIVGVAPRVGPHRTAFPGRLATALCGTAPVAIRMRRRFVGTNQTKGGCAARVKTFHYSRPRGPVKGRPHALGRLFSEFWPPPVDETGWRKPAVERGGKESAARKNGRNLPPRTGRLADLPADFHPTTRVPPALPVWPACRWPCQPRSADRRLFRRRTGRASGTHSRQRAGVTRRSGRGPEFPTAGNGACRACPRSCRPKSRRPRPPPRPTWRPPCPWRRRLRPPRR